MLMNAWKWESSSFRRSSQDEHWNHSAYEWRPAFDLQGYIVHCFTFRISCESSPAGPSSAAQGQLLAASQNWVLPSESSEFASTLSRARNSFTTASCPSTAANNNGVRPSESLEFASTLSCARNN